MHIVCTYLNQQRQVRVYSIGQQTLVKKPHMHRQQGMPRSKFVRNPRLLKPAPGGRRIMQLQHGKEITRMSSAFASQYLVAKRSHYMSSQYRKQCQTHGSLAWCCAVRNNRSPSKIRFFCPSREYRSHSCPKMPLLSPMPASSRFVVGAGGGDACGCEDGRHRTVD